MTVIHANQHWPASERLLTVGDLARSLSISKQTAYGLIHSGAIKALKVGEQYRIHPRAVAEYLERDDNQPKGRAA